MHKEPKPVAETSAQAEISALKPTFASAIQLRVAVDHFLFEFVYGGEPVVLLARLAVSPEHAKRFRDVLNRQIRNYERQFGPLASLPSGKPNGLAKRKKSVRNAKRKRKKA